MRDNLKRESLFLHYLTRLDEKTVKSVIKNLTQSQVRTISGIIYNAARRRISFKRSDIDKLKKFNSSWSLLVSKSTALSKKKLLLKKRWKEVSFIIKTALKWIPVKI